MSFRSPWGLLALLLIVPVVLLYILKKQHEDRTVSSIMLWQQVLRDLQAARPWQRLRTRLLLLLQILAVLLFALSLARPACFGGEGGVHYIAVLDASARMQATDIRPSRLVRPHCRFDSRHEGKGYHDSCRRQETPAGQPFK